MQAIHGFGLKFFMRGQESKLRLKKVQPRVHIIKKEQLRAYNNTDKKVKQRPSSEEGE